MIEFWHLQAVNGGGGGDDDDDDTHLWRFLVAIIHLGSAMTRVVDPWTPCARSVPDFLKMTLSREVPAVRSTGWGHCSLVYRGTTNLVRDHAAIKRSKEEHLPKTACHVGTSSINGGFSIAMFDDAGGSMV